MAGERVQAAAADVLREKEESWNASVVTAVCKTEKICRAVVRTESTSNDRVS